MPKKQYDYGNVIVTVFIILLMCGGGILAWDYLRAEDIIEEPDVRDAYWGNVNFKVSNTDALGGAAHTCGTVVYKYFSASPTDDMGGVAITITGTVIELDESQNGICYMTLDLGDDEYPMANWMESAFKKQNPKVKTVSFEDLTGDDKDEMILKVDLSKLQKGTTDPVFTLKMPWFDEDVASWTDGDPADITAIGEVAGTETTITWKLGGITAEDAGVIGKLYFVTNDTREGNDVRLTKVKMYGAWKVYGTTSWAAPTSISASAYEAYYFMPTDYTDPVEGILCYRDTNDADALYIDLTVKCYFETNDQVTVDIYLELIGGDGATTQVTDTVTLAEA